MFEKIKNIPKEEIIELVRDVRVAGLLVFTVIVLLISWSGVKVIESNYQLQKQISALQQENAVQQLQNNNLKLQNEYYNTDQYLEIAARQNFGLGAPGEKELLVSRDVALAHAAALPADKTTTSAEAEKQQFFIVRNVQAWWHFFTHGSSN